MQAGSGAAGSTGDIILISDTGAITNLTNGWTYVNEAEIDSVTPSNGTRGTSVTIAGDGLLAGGNSVQSVTLAGIPAKVSFFNDTLIVVEAKSSDGVRITGDVLITMDTGSQVKLDSGWTYLEGSVIYTVEPSSGQSGTAVLLSGFNMLGGGQFLASATLAGVSGTIKSFSDVAGHLIAAAHNKGAIGDIVLTSNTGASTSRTRGWSYIKPATLASLKPARGQGGTTVHITGERLLHGGSVANSVKLAGVSVAKKRLDGKIWYFGPKIPIFAIQAFWATETPENRHA